MVFRRFCLLSPEGAVSEGTGAKRDSALIRTKSVNERGSDLIARFDWPDLIGMNFVGGETIAKQQP